MELLWLRYFKKLAETGHLTRTAEQLHISPPSLSATISRLEKELETRLFDRPGREIRLNSSGRTFLHYVNIALSAIDEAKHEFSSSSDSTARTISIGVTSPVRYQRSLFAFMKAHPDVHLSQNVIDLPYFHGDELLKTYDFVLSAALDFDLGDCDRSVLYSDDVPMLAVSSSHPFASLKSISLAEAQNCMFIVTPKGSSARIFFDDVFAAAHITPNMIIECDYSMRKDMIIDQYGIGLSTLTTSLDDRSSDIVYIPISDPVYHRTHVISWHMNRSRSETAKLFYSFMLSYYRNGIRSLFPQTGSASPDKELS
jgi:LysR family transcriptional regulator, transcription activator of glutamate synthase operon